MPARTTPTEFSWKRLRACTERRLAQRRPIRARLPGGGRLVIDRPLPFLIVYRIPPRPDAGTANLVTSESSYLIASGSEELATEVRNLCRSVVDCLQKQFVTVVLIEIWSDGGAHEAHNSLALVPAFEIVTETDHDVGNLRSVLRTSLERITLGDSLATVDVTMRTGIAPLKLSPLQLNLAPLTREPPSEARCQHVGLAVRPIYQTSSADGVYPLVLQRLRRRLSSALRQALYQITGMDAQTPRLPPQALGPSRMQKSAERVDQQLSKIAASFDFLLQVSPANSEQAWNEFQTGGCRNSPRLYYRPLPYRPSLLKRRLFAIRTEHVDDPALFWLFSQKQVELDRQMTALRDIGTPLFRYSSLQLSGRPDSELTALADSILETTRNAPESAIDREPPLDAAAMARRAQVEIDAYRQEQPAFEARVEVTDGIAAGIMVSGDRLLISSSIKVEPHRCVPLLQHEIGTHLLTFFNGRAQPLRLLARGLARCEELQEGLAVLSEYLSGGLSLQRLRVLAARVFAINAMLNDTPFPETYDQLVHQHAVPARVAFMTVLRAYRGGGLTKDVLYLRGLHRLLSYMSDGNSLEPLYVGKIALQHVGLVQELQARGIVRAPLLLPRFWMQAAVRTRLESCRRATVMDLLRESLQVAQSPQPGEDI